MELDKELIVKIAESMREDGPPDDCMVNIMDVHHTLGHLFRTWAEIAEANKRPSMYSAIAATFKYGFEVGLQYAELSGKESKV